MCVALFVVFFCKQKTAYEMRISDWSSDVCSSDLQGLSEVEDPYRRVLRYATSTSSVATQDERRCFLFRRHGLQMPMRLRHHRRQPKLGKQRAILVVPGIDRKSTRLNSSH